VEQKNIKADYKRYQLDLDTGRTSISIVLKTCPKDKNVSKWTYIELSDMPPFKRETKNYNSCFVYCLDGQAIVFLPKSDFWGERTLMEGDSNNLKKKDKGPSDVGGV